MQSAQFMNTFNPPQYKLFFITLPLNQKASLLLPETLL
jgi:hypothetical protein